MQYSITNHDSLMQQLAINEASPVQPAQLPYNVIRRIANHLQAAEVGRYRTLGPAFQNVGKDPTTGVNKARRQQSVRQLRAYVAQLDAANLVFKAAAWPQYQLARRQPVVIMHISKGWYGITPKKQYGTYSFHTAMYGPEDPGSMYGLPGAAQRVAMTPIEVYKALKHAKKALRHVLKHGHMGLQYQSAFKQERIEPLLDNIHGYLQDMEALLRHSGLLRMFKAAAAEELD
jgi:hypothetical protein